MDYKSYELMDYVSRDEPCGGELTEFIQLLGVAMYLYKNVRPRHLGERPKVIASSVSTQPPPPPPPPPPPTKTQAANEPPPVENMKTEHSTEEEQVQEEHEEEETPRDILVRRLFQKIASATHPDRVLEQKNSTIPDSYFDIASSACEKKDLRSLIYMVGILRIPFVLKSGMERQIIECETRKLKTEIGMLEMANKGGGRFVFHKNEKK